MKKAKIITSPVICIIIALITIIITWLAFAYIADDFSIVFEDVEIRVLFIGFAFFFATAGVVLYAGRDL